MKIVGILGSIAYAFFIVFAGKFCKQSNPPDVNTSESLARLAVEDGGGRWVGIQEFEGESFDLVLFNSPSTGSTLALRTSEITAASVRRRIEESDAAFHIRQNS